MSTPKHDVANNIKYSLITSRSEIVVSQSTKDKAESIKAFIQGKYIRKKQEEKEKKEGDFSLHD